MLKRMALAGVVALTLLAKGGHSRLSAGEPAGAAKQPEERLLIWYRFDDLQGPAAADASGKGNAAAFDVPPAWNANDPAPLAGNRGSVALGKGNKLTLASTANLGNLKSLTLGMWVRGKPLGDLVQGPVRWRFAPELLVQISGAGVPAYDLSKGSALDGWHHWAVTYDGTDVLSLFNVRYYLDGRCVLAARCNGYWSPGVVKFGGPLTIAPDLANPIDDFRLYGSAEDGSAALSPLEINAVAGKAETPEQYLNSLLALALPGGEFKEERLVTILAFIREHSRILDPAREGIRIEIHQPALEQKLFTVDLKGKSIGAALQEVCGLADLSLTPAPPNTVKLAPAKGAVKP